MRWQGRRESSNVEDRRSSGGGFGGGKPTGVLGLIIILVGAYYGVDLSGLVGEMEVGTTQSSPLQFPLPRHLVTLMFSFTAEITIPIEI